MPKLTEQLAEMRAISEDGSAHAAIRDRAIDEIIERGVALGLDQGERIPDFALPDAFGRIVSSAELLATGPLVISFYRGSWCPSCNLELRAFEVVADQIADLGASIVAISPQRPDQALSLTEKHSLSYPVLSDLDRSVIRAFRLNYAVPAELRAMFEGRGNDLSQQNADGTWTLPISATYVTDRSGHVIAAHAAADWRTRLDPEDVVAALSTLDR